MSDPAQPAAQVPAAQPAAPAVAPVVAPAAAPVVPAPAAPAVAPVAPVVAPVVAPAAPVAAPAAPAPAPVVPAAEPDAATQVASLRAELHREKITGSVHKLATELGAIDLDTVLKLTADAFAVDDKGNVFVRAEPTKSPKDYLSGYLTARPYLLKPALPAGAGASPNVSPPAAGAPALDLRSADGATTFARNVLGQRVARLNPTAPSAPAGQTPGAVR